MIYVEAQTFHPTPSVVKPPSGDSVVLIAE